MKKNNNKNLIAISIAFIGLAILGIIGLTYAFFTAGVTGNENATQTVIETADLRLVFNDTQIISLDNALPGVSVSKVFTVQNTGNVRQRYDIDITDVTNTFINDELVYTITSDNVDGGEVIETPMPIEDSTLLTSSIDPGVTITYTITLKFKETGAVQNANQGAIFNGKLQIVPRIMGVALGGYVYDENDNPLSNVTVELNSDPIIVQTDEEGYYEISDAPIGNHTLYIKQSETVLGSKEIVLLSSNESKIQNNNQIYLPDKVSNKYLNIKVATELNITIVERALALKWKKNFGGANPDYYRAVSSTSDGYVAVGMSASADGDLVGLNNGGGDAIIVKYDVNGNVVWKKNFGGTGADFFQSVITVSDGYIVVGDSRSTDGDLTGLNKGDVDGIIVKYDLDGDVVWKKNFGGTGYDYFASVASASDGYVAVGFSYSTDGDLSGLNVYSQDAIIIKYDTNGNVVWRKSLRGDSDELYTSVTKVSDGYVAVGYSDSYAIPGFTNKGQIDAIIVKYDLNGNEVWKKNFGGNRLDFFYSITAISDGYIVAGNSSSTNGDLNGLNKGEGDGIIVKYDTNGNVVWKKNYGGSNEDHFQSVFAVSDGFVTTGYSESTDADSTGLNNGDKDGIIVKYDLNGNVVWKKNYGGSSIEWLYSVTFAFDKYIVVGESNSTDKDVAGLNKGYYDAIIAAFKY